MEILDSGITVFVLSSQSWKIVEKKNSDSVGRLKKIN